MAWIGAEPVSYAAFVLTKFRHGRNRTCALSEGLDTSSSPGMPQLSSAHTWAAAWGSAAWDEVVAWGEEEAWGLAAWGEVEAWDEGEAWERAAWGSAAQVMAARVRAAGKTEAGKACRIRKCKHVM